MIELSVIRDLVAIFGVIAGFTYYVMTVRNSQRMQKMQLETRQAQLFMQIFNRFQEVEFRNNINEIITREWEDYDDHVKKYGRYTNPTAQAVSASTALFFEGLGVLLKRGLLDIDIVGELMSTPVRIYWEKVSPVIMGMRDRMKREAVMESAEYLYEEMMKRDVRLGRDKEFSDPYEEP
jgi:hypothetical protein